MFRALALRQSEYQRGNARSVSENFLQKKSFLEWEKMAKDKIFWHFLHIIFFMFILLISY